MASLNTQSNTAASVSSPSTQIYVVGLDKTLVLNVDLAKTVESVKQIISDKTGIPVVEQRLVGECKSLDSNMSLASCGIEQESTLFLTLYIMGGMPYGQSNTGYGNYPSASSNSSYGQSNTGYGNYSSASSNSSYGQQTGGYNNSYSSASSNSSYGKQTSNPNSYMTNTDYYDTAGVSFVGATGQTKKVKYNQNVYVGETHAPDEYDRTYKNSYWDTSYGSGSTYGNISSSSSKNTGYSSGYSSNYGSSGGYR